MGRASTAKKDRRAQRARLLTAPPRARGGRPRIHENDAAKHRAFRLRKKAGTLGRASVATTESDLDEVVDLVWFDGPEYVAWLADGERRLGLEWLTTQLEFDAEIILAEKDFG
jgi:hypothetical protein